MNDYEAVVADYLMADRALFVNTQCLIQLNPGQNPDTCGPHWYCDAVAVDLRDQCIFLCEISYQLRLDALVKRLRAWCLHWEGVREALERDCAVPKGWPIRTWMFVPDSCVARLTHELERLPEDGRALIQPRITPLEMVQPWAYCSWDRVGEKPKATVPDCMRT